MKKIVVILGIILAIISLLSNVSAENGSCGDGVTWSLMNDILTISGTGAMENYDFGNNQYAPWYDQRSEIKSVLINNGVTNIGGSAFVDCNNLTNVTIPEGVTSIGEWAFENCSRLKNVVLPRSLQLIGDHAFAQCSSLKSVSLAPVANSLVPDNMTTIQPYAFMSCGTLTEISIPATVELIGANAFESCTSLAHIWFEGSSAQWDAISKGSDWNKGVPYNVHYHYSVARPTVVNSGTCGTDLTWTLTNQGVLTIFGTGTQVEYGEWNKESVRKIIISEGVKTIRSSTFSNCENVTNVELPSTLLSIGSWAFLSCKSLTSICIPSLVQTIIRDAFDNCPNLVSFSVEEGNTAFSAEDGILYNANKSTLIICPAGKTGIVIIPDTVRTIGNSAFYKCVDVTEISIPNGVTTINSSAFCYCNGLTIITIPNSVTMIGQQAFSNCTALVEVHLSANITSISSLLFCRCTSLTGIDIPAKVTTIGQGAFSYSGLTQINIPSSVTVIEGDVFEDCDGLRQVIIPYGVTSVGYFAFEHCDNLEKLVIPGSVVSLGRECFSTCPKLTEITIPGNFEWYNLQVNNPKLFTECPAIETVTFDSDVTIRLSSICDSLSSLTSVYIADSVENVSRVLPGRVIYANAGTNGAKALGEADYSFIDIESGWEYKHLYSGNTYTGLQLLSTPEGLTEVDIPDGVTHIGNYAFSQCCETLESVNLPDGLISIGYNAFANSAIQTITIPGSVTNMSSYVFSGCENLTSIIFEDGASGMDYYAFEGSNAIRYAGLNTDAARALGRAGKSFRTGNVKYGLQYMFDDQDKEVGLAICEVDKDAVSITIPDYVDMIGNSAFSECEQLTTVSIPDNVQQIGDYAFYNCNSLKNVAIPYGVPNIGNYTFYCCENLEALVIPDSVTSIGNYGICCCSSLLAIKIPDECKVIGESAFGGCSRLKNIVIPDGVTCIKDGMFSGCYDLSSVTLPDSVTSIERMAFIQCYSLSGIKLPANLTIIGDGAFAYCTELTGIILPDKLITIDSRAFQSCLKLGSITIPASVTDIGNNAFDTGSEFSKICFLGKGTTIGSHIVSDAPDVYCYHDSTAETWADALELDITYLEDISLPGLLSVTMPERCNIPVNSRHTLPVEIFYASPIQSITWTSDDESVLLVDGIGTLTPLKAGTATITCTADGVSDSTFVTVRPVISEISVPMETIYTAGTTLVEFSYSPADAAFDFSFSMPNGYIFYQYGGRGKAVVALGSDEPRAMTLQIKDKISGISCTVPVRASRNVTDVSIDTDTMTMHTGQQKQVRVNVTVGRYQCTNQLVFWSSSDESVATVDRFSGKITALKTGEVTITATAQNNDDLYDLCVITVSEGPRMILPENLKTVEDEAFANVKDIMIVLPDGIESISDSAFDPSVTIVCKQGGYAYNRCMELGLTVIEE